MLYKKKDEDKYIKIIQEEGYDADMYTDSELFDIYSKHKKYEFNTQKLYLDTDECYSWDDEKKVLEDSDLDIVYIRDLYLFDHGGLVLSTSSFNDRWDSGQLGLIYITKKKLINYFGDDRLDEERIKEINRLLKGYIDNYNNILNGQVFGYRYYELIKFKTIGKLINLKTNEIEDIEEIKVEEVDIDSCSGFIGIDGLLENICVYIGENSNNFELIEED